MIQKEIKFSDYVIERLSSLGVKHIFSITGGGVMHLVDSIARNKDIEFAAVHNECFAGASADAYARSSNGLGVAIGTTGPGLSNLFTSVVVAYQDSSPVLFIGGQVKSSDSSRINDFNVRQNGTFEFDSIDCFKPITKYCEIIKSFEDGIDKLEAALHQMFDDRLGPALLEIPLDIQGQKRTRLHVKKYVQSLKIFKRKDDYKLDTLLKSCVSKLNKFEKPLVILGNGVSRIVDKSSISQFLKNNNLPYVTTPLSKDLQSLNNESFLGIIGLRGNRAANIATQEADAILIIGSSMHQSVVGWEPKKFNQKAYKIWCEIDASVTDLRSQQLNVKNVFNVTSEVVSASIFDLDLKIKLSWINYCKYLKEKFYEHIVTNSSNNSYYEYLHVLSKHGDKFSAVTADAGLATYIVPQVFNFDKGQKFASPGSLGSMGMARPYGLGVYLSLKRQEDDRHVLIVIGDGSMMACLQELASLKQNGFRGVVIIVNNNGYRSIRETHDKFFNGIKVGTDPSNGVFIPQISALAKAFEMPYSIFKNATELDHFLSSEKLNNIQIFELISDENQLIEPKVVSILNNNGEFETPDLGEMQPHRSFLTYETFKRQN